MYDFYPSDLGTQTISRSKYYWQNEEAKCCVLVPDTSRECPDKPVPVYFLQIAPNVDIFCTDQQNPDHAFVSATPGFIDLEVSVFERKNGRCVRPENCGKILNAILDLVDEGSWSFPRAKSNTPYITSAQATLLESTFKTMVQAPDNGTCIHASVAAAGKMLADRLDITSDVVYAVQHYEQSTNTQDDQLVKVVPDRDIDLIGKDVIVIDDLISSGRTANAVIEHILSAGASHVYFFSLYRTICSREVDLLEDPRVTIQSYVPLSNAYWTYGRGFDLTDNESRNLPDIYAATKHWDWETSEDVTELINYFAGKSRRTISAE